MGASVAGRPGSAQGEVTLHGISGIGMILIESDQAIRSPLGIMGTRKIRPTRRIELKW